MKVKLKTSKIKPIDEEEKQILEALDGEIIEIPDEMIKNTPDYKGEENVGILEPVFESWELVKISVFVKNPTKYISMLQSWKIKKIWIVENDKKIAAVIYPFS